MSNGSVGVQQRLERPVQRSKGGTTKDDSQRGRHMRFPLVLPVLGLAALAGCGGSDDESSNPTATSSPTTVAATSSSTPRTSGTSRVDTTASSRPTPTEPAATGLTNGRHPVYLTGVDTGRRTISVDLVQLLDRNSAEAAKVCPEIVGGDIDGYCIKNVNPQLRTLPVPSTASIRVLSGSSLRKVDLAGLAAARRPQREESFYEVTVSGGKVTAVKELYRP